MVHVGTGVAGDLASKRRLVAVAVALFGLGYGLAVGPGPIWHYDHQVFRRTLELQRRGADYYDAYVRAFGDGGVELSQFRSVRQPGIFLLWQWLPTDLLWPLFVACVAVGVSWILLRLTDAPMAVLPVTAYLLFAGRVPSTHVVEQWLLVEMWAVIPLAVSVVAWHRGHHRTAAAAAAVAFLIREITAGFLLIGLVAAWRTGDRRARRAWLTATTGAVIGYGLHVVAALPHLSQTGNEAAIVGTARPPDTIVQMIGWMVPGPDVIAVAVFLLALVRLSTRPGPAITPLLGLFTIPAAGALVSRPYWGLVFIPFAILLAGEQVAAWAGALAAARRRTLDRHDVVIDVTDRKMRQDAAGAGRAAGPTVPARTPEPLG